MRNNYEAPNAEWLAFSLNETLMENKASGMGEGTEQGNTGTEGWG